jgi:hypothetical protein
MAGWFERVNLSKKLISNNKIGYVGCKDYSLYVPLKWYEQIMNKDNALWMSLGIKLLNISQHASDIGDNRAGFYLESAVAEAAGRSGPKGLWEFSFLSKNSDKYWIRVIFDGIIAAMEEGEFTKKELISIWKIGTDKFYVLRNPSVYDTDNEIHKSYITDLREGIIRVADRYLYCGIKDEMRKLASYEYSITYDSKSPRSYKVIKRWWEEKYIHPEAQDFYDENNSKSNKEIFDIICTIYFDSEIWFEWDIVIVFIDRIRNNKDESIQPYIDKIICMLMLLNGSTSQFSGKGAKIIGLLAPYFDLNQRIKVYDLLLSIYFKDNYDEESKMRPLLSILEHLFMGYYFNLSSDDNIQGLEKLIQLHTNWITGYDKLRVVNKAYDYPDNNSKDMIGWEDICIKLKTNY